MKSKDFSEEKEKTCSIKRKMLEMKNAVCFWRKSHFGLNYWIKITEEKGDEFKITAIEIV